MAETADRWIAAHGRRIFCRVYRPRVDRALPTMVYFHGGGWVWASVDTHDRLVREYCAAGEVAAVSVDYALSPEAKFPQALEECVAALRWIAAHGADWGLDTSRLLLGGDSAGGNLALATALLARDTGGPALRGILTTYPVCDSALDTPSYQEFGDGAYGLSKDRMAFYWSVYVPHAADRLHPLAAPLRADLRGCRRCWCTWRSWTCCVPKARRWWRGCAMPAWRWRRRFSPAWCTASCAPRRRWRRRGRRWRRRAPGYGGWGRSATGAVSLSG